MKILYAFFFTLLISSLKPLIAQQDCAQKLLQAQVHYNTGQVERIPDLLKDCLQSGFTREEELTAYKLLIYTCILDDELYLADNYMLAFLAKFPNYRPSSADPSQFVNLMKEFDNRPRYSLGISAGVNTADVKVIESYGLHDINAVNGRYLATSLGFQSGLVFSKMLTRNLETALKPKYYQTKYDYKINPFPFAYIDYSETHNGLIIPLSFSMGISKHKLNPYIEAGFAARFLSSAKSTVSRKYQNTGSLLVNDILGSSTDISYKRRQMNFSVNYGGGVKYLTSLGYFFMEATYYYSFLSEVNNSERNPANDDLSLIYYYVDNDFRVNLFTLSMGFCYSLYRPKKL